MAIPVIVYAGAYAAGQLGGVALGTAVIRKVKGDSKKPGYYTGSSPYDLYQELNRLGFKY